MWAHLSQEVLAAHMKGTHPATQHTTKKHGATTGPDLKAAMSMSHLDVQAFLVPSLQQRSHVEETQREDSSNHLGVYVPVRAQLVPGEPGVMLVKDQAHFMHLCAQPTLLTSPHPQVLVCSRRYRSPPEVRISEPQIVPL
eukprot:4024575-Amphidinium_carterae.1